MWTTIRVNAKGISDEICHLSVAVRDPLPTHPPSGLQGLAHFFRFVRY